MIIALFYSLGGIMLFLLIIGEPANGNDWYVLATGFFAIIVLFLGKLLDILEKR